MIASKRRKYLILQLWPLSGGGQVAIVLTFYSVDPSLNPAEVYNISCLKFALK